MRSVFAVLGGDDLELQPKSESSTNFICSVTKWNPLNYVRSLLLYPTMEGALVTEKRQLTGLFALAHICCHCYAKFSYIFLRNQEKMVTVIGIVTGSFYVPQKDLHT